MTRSVLLCIALLCALAPAASAAPTLTFEDPDGDTYGTYVFTADSTGDNLNVSAMVRSYDVGGQMTPFDVIQISAIGPITQQGIPAGFCPEVDGDDRVYCSVSHAEDGTKADAFRYEGVDAVDKLYLSREDTPSFFPWLAVTFNARGGADLAQGDSIGAKNTALHTWDMGAQDDKVYAYGGNDVLLGGEHDDLLEGGAGSQVLRGGGGNDTLYGDKFEKNYGADVIDGGPGFDIGDEWNLPESDAVNPPVSITQDGVANDGRTGEGDNVTSIEKINTNAVGSFQATDGDDVFQIYGDGSTITLLAGADQFDGGQGTQTVDGGAGNDKINGGYGNDTITGGPGQDTINGDGGSYCGIYSCSVPFGNDTIYVRDGEADQVECGVGTDKVEADALDTVSDSCETIDRGTGGGGGGGGTAPGGGGGTTPGGGGGGTPAEAFAFKVLSKLSIKTLLKSGGSFSISCGEACEITIDLLYKGKKVGTGKKALLTKGTAKVPVKVARKHRRKLKRLKRGKFVVRVTIKDASGKTTTFTKTLSFKK